MRARPIITIFTALIICFCLVVLCLVLLSQPSQDGHGSRLRLIMPASTQGQQALVAAQLEAAHSEPAGTAPAVVKKAADITASSFGPDVTGATWLTSTRRAADEMIDGSSSPDDNPVEVVRMVGSFVINTTGPPGSSPTHSGSVETFLVDESTGYVVDFSLGDASQLPPLPGAVTLLTSS